jgi:hypothetical protein
MLAVELATTCRQPGTADWNRRHGRGRDPAAIPSPASSRSAHFQRARHRRRTANLLLRAAKASSTALRHSGGTGPDRGANAISVGDKQFLLTVTGGAAVHLSRESRPDRTARSAVPIWHLRPRRVDSRAHWRAYHRAALTEPRWAETTLCGRQWIAMAGDEGGDADEPGDDAFAPTCRRCLAIMDKLFAEPVLDDRFPLIVQIIADTVAEHGYAEIRNVPGDQQAALRKQVRSAVRQQTGHGPQTLFTRASQRVLRSLTDADPVMLNSRRPSPSSTGTRWTKISSTSPALMHLPARPTPNTPTSLAPAASRRWRRLPGYCLTGT